MLVIINNGGLQETCTSYDHVIIESYLKHTFPLKSSRIFRAEQLSRVYITQKRKNGYPIFCSAAFFRLSCKLCTALSRYAHLPTEKIQRFCRQREYGKNSDAENGFRLPAALNLSTACHDGVGLGECKKREKERFVFERFFVGTERRKPLFALLLIYTAKNGKT